MSITATYSPDDNKLRLYTMGRLDEETYKRVHDAGFRWAPKQELFVCPAWSPTAEDVCLALAEEITDEDTSLTERAEVRAERFETYAENRASDGEAAQASAERIMDGIPLGQPILVGHHSERRARKDAEKIRGGLERAAKAFETSDYWTRRAAGAVRAAKYKERPDVRARRIKGLESDVRRHEKSQEKSTLMLRLWTKLPNAARRKDGSPMTPDEQALAIANIDHGYGLWSDLSAGRTTWEAAQAKRTAELPKMIAYEARWLAHLAGRLAYERGMLAEAGGTVADRTKPEVGGAVLCWVKRGAWLPIVKVNKVTVTVTDSWLNGGRTFPRKVAFTDLGGVLSAADVAARLQAGTLVASGPAYHDVAPDVAVPPPPAKLELTMIPSAREKAKALRSAASGVKAVSARNLFETPPAVARQMAELAEIQPGERILEPSAGTGNLVRAIFGRTIGADGARLVTVEVNPELAEGLETQRQKTLYANADTWRIERGDFLGMTPEQLGTFHAVVMNPPFESGTDIVHVKHAMRFVRPGGCVVAIVADGPRQQEALRPIAASWEALPAGTFRGTNVRAAVVKIEVQQ